MAAFAQRHPVDARAFQPRGELPGAEQVSVRA